MSTRRFEVTLTGVNDLLMHADDIAWRDGMVAWQADPENKRNSKAGDDRTPAWRWLGYAYNDGKHIGIPADNLMTTLREGGVKVPVPGKKSLTYKKQSQSGLLVNEILWPIETSAGFIDWPNLWVLREEDDFEAHMAKVESLGFELFVKAAKVGMAKHIRVRPRFRNWSASGTLTVLDETINPQVLQMILDHAGKYCGIGDWRPSSPKSPGPWGTFISSIKEI